MEARDVGLPLLRVGVPPVVGRACDSLVACPPHGPGALAHTTLVFLPPVRARTGLEGHGEGAITILSPTISSGVAGEVSRFATRSRR